MRAVAFIVSGAFHETHFKAGDAFESFGQSRACGVGRLNTIAETLARAAVDHDRRDHRQRLAVFAGEGWIGERKQTEQERQRAQDRAAGA
jgi:hypothetical protein